MNIIIDPEFQSLIRPLTDDEFRQLECSVLDDGLIDPLVVWAPDGILLDGHHRYRVCQKHGLEVKVAPLHFDSRADARQWIKDHQLGRRNVTPEEAAFLRGEEYLNAEKHQGARVDLQSPPPSETSGQSDTKSPIHLADRLAGEHDVSPRTIKRDAKFAESLGELTTLLGEVFKADVLAGKSGLGKEDIVALAEMPREDVKGKAGDYAALREAAAARRDGKKAAGKDNKNPRKPKCVYMTLEDLRAMAGVIARACQDCPDTFGGCIEMFKNILEIAGRAVKAEETANA